MTDKLRQYQVRQHDRILTALCDERDVLFSSPTGSGKTTVVTSVAGEMGRGDWNGAVITAPMETVRQGFVTNWSAPDGLFDETIYGSAGSRVTAFERWIRKHWQDRAFAAALCWQTFVQAKLPRDLTGWVWFIDEAHNSVAKANAKEDKALSLKREEWRKRGGRIVAVSATPYRTDRKPVYTEDYVTVRRSIAEHSMPDKDGNRYAPEKFEIRASGLDDYHVRTAKEHRGEQAPRTIGPRAIKRLIKAWRAAGRPKTIVIVPPGDSESWSRRVGDAFARERVPYRGGGKAKVHNAVGTGAGFQRELVELLEAERGVTQIGESQVDVIVACARFNEGTDWPLCSHVFQVGFPSSIRLTNQRWGRAFRSKAGIAGHPHPEVASITFFVPTMTEEVREEISASKSERLHMRMALLMAGHLEDHEAGQKLVSVVRDIVKMNAPLRGGIDLEALEERLLPTDEEMQDVNEAYRYLRPHEGQLELAQIDHIADHFDLSMRERLMLRIRVAHAIEAVDPEASEALLGQIHAAARKLFRSEKSMSAAARKRGISDPLELLAAEAIEVFDAFVTEDYAGRIRFDPPITEKHWYMLTQFTGRDAKDLDMRMRMAVDIMLTEGLVRRALAEYYSDHRTSPLETEDAEPYIGYPIPWRVPMNWVRRNSIVAEVA